MTEKLYWIDSYQTRFNAVVLNVNNQGIILDKTLFYPEGGNQVSDKGIIKKGGYEFEVDHVSKQEDMILHHLTNNFQKFIKKGDIIEGIIHWQYRYGIMRSHSSQHLLSAIFKNKLNIDTTRANITFEDVTLHISEPVNIEQLEEVLAEFLKICTIDNLQFNSRVISRNEVERLNEGVRGDLSDETLLRIVEIQGFDINCCGGTHVKNSAEIGPSFFYDIKKGSEFKYFVGDKAIKMLSRNNLEIINLANSLNTPIKGILITAKDQITKLNQENINYINKMLEIFANNPLFVKDIKYGILDFEIDYKLLSKKFKEFPPNYVLIMKRSPKNLLILSNTDQFKSNELITYLIKKYGGKGGGSPKSAQVSLVNEPKDLLFDIEKNF